MLQILPAVGEEIVEFCAEGLHVVGFVQLGVCPVCGDFLHHAPVVYKSGQPRGYGLDDGNAEAVVPCGIDKGVHGFQQCRHIVAQSGKGHVVFQPVLFAVVHALVENIPLALARGTDKGEVEVAAILLQGIQKTANKQMVAPFAETANHAHLHAFARVVSLDDAFAELGKIDAVVNNPALVFAAEAAALQIATLQVIAHEDNPVAAAKHQSPQQSRRTDKPESVERGHHADGGAQGAQHGNDGIERSLRVDYVYMFSF